MNDVISLLGAGWIVHSVHVCWGMYGPDTRCVHGAVRLVSFTVTN